MLRSSLRTATVTEWILCLIIGLSGALLCIRTLAGPFALVHSPLNLEGAFVLALLLLAVLRSKSGAPPKSPPRWTFDAPAIVSLAVLTALAFASNAHDYFLSDDFLVIHYANDFHFAFRPLLATGGGDGFFRPVTNLSLALSAPWAQFDPLRWHVLEIAFHAANAILTYALARLLRLDSLCSWFAAALFALHGTRPEAALWISGRFDLQAAFFVLIALILYLRSHLVLALLAMALGILSKESAYVVPFLIALLPPSQGDSGWKLRARASMPFLAVAALLFAYRWVLFGNVGGYLNASGQPEAFTFSLLSAAKGLFFRTGAILFFPINWSWRLGWVWGWALALILPAYLAALGYLAWTASGLKRLLVPLGFTLIAALPTLPQLLIGTDLQKARYLYLPSVGFCLLLAMLGENAPLRMRSIAWVALLAFQVAALKHNFEPWSYAASKTRPACIAAADSVRKYGPRVIVAGLPGSLNGVYFFSNGFPTCVDAELGGELSEVELRPAGTDEKAPVLSWNPVLDELK